MTSLTDYLTFAVVFATVFAVVFSITTLLVWNIILSDRKHAEPQVKEVIRYRAPRASKTGKEAKK